MRHDKEGRFSESHTDFFDNPTWDELRQRAQRKAIEMRGQGWSGAAMLPYSELEYGGLRDTVSALLKRFRLREGAQAGSGRVETAALDRLLTALVVSTLTTSSSSVGWLTGKCVSSRRRGAAAGIAHDGEPGGPRV